MLWCENRGQIIQTDVPHVPKPAPDKRKALKDEFIFTISRAFINAERAVPLDVSGWSGTAILDQARETDEQARYRYKTDDVFRWRVDALTFSLLDTVETAL